MIHGDAVIEFNFIVMSDTRCGCIDKMDELGMLVLDNAGGMPWVMVDDDLLRQPAATEIKDAHGMAYVGRRRYKFAGPISEGYGMTMRPDFSPQKAFLDV